MSQSLKENQLFFDLSEADLDELAKICPEKDFKEGNIIFSKGKQSDELYILTDGECEVRLPLTWKPVAGAEEHYTLSRFKGPHVFGELGFVTGTPRTATIRCSRNSKVLVLKKADFENFANLNPKAGLVICNNLAKIIAERLRVTNDQLKDFYMKIRTSIGNLF